MPDISSLLAFFGFASIIFCSCWFIIFLCTRLCFGNGEQQVNDRHHRHDEVDLRPYELPIIDPIATVQDHHQLQVNLRPFHIPIMDSIAPSAPRLDLVDLPPSYEEAVKTTMSTQV